jgi:hypothetical protein
MLFEEVIEVEASFGKDSIRGPDTLRGFQETEFVGIELPGV